LKIRASKELGEAGTVAAAVTEISWYPWYSARNWPLWIVMFLFLLSDENRNRRAWMVLVPTVIVIGMGSVINMLLPQSAGQIENTYAQIISTMALSAAILCLALQRILNYAALPRFLATIGLLIVTGFVATYTFSGLSLDNEAGSIIVMQCAWALSLTAAMTTARRFYPRGICGRFGLITALVMIIVFDIILLVSLLASLAVQGDLRYNLGPVFTAIAIQGSIIGGIFYILTLPFLILAGNSDFYRARLAGMLGFENKIEVRNSLPQSE
jgi:hypothetical protein